MANDPSVASGELAVLRASAFLRSAKSGQATLLSADDLRALVFYARRGLRLVRMAREAD